VEVPEKVTAIKIPLKPRVLSIKENKIQGNQA